MFHDHQTPLEPEYSPMDHEEREEGFYKTGNTVPPKRGGGLLAVVLVAAVLLGSLVAIGATENASQPGETTEASADTSQNSGSLSGSSEPNTEPTAPTDGDTNKEQKNTEALTISPTPKPVANPTQEDGLSLQEIYQKVNPSTVSITAASASETNYGCGIIMTDSGYIITNCHVIEGARALSVTLHDGNVYEATLVGKDVASDLAVLRIFAENLAAAEFGDSGQVQVGDIAVAIGDPLGLELRGTMTSGIISAINRDLTIEGRTMTLLQTTAALNEGNSGGPLINCYGQVVGINTLKVGSSYRSEVEGLGFAIPIDTAKEIIDQLIAVGYVPGRASLGVETTVFDNPYRFYYDLPEGLYVAYVEPGSHAWERGLRGGDTIISIGGEEVKSKEDLNAILAKYTAGDEVAIIVYRDHMVYDGRLILQEAGG